METNIHLGEHVEDQVVVESVRKDILVSDIPDSITGVKGDDQLLVMVGAEIVAPKVVTSKNNRQGSGLVSVPTILEAELEELLAKSHSLDAKDGMESYERTVGHATPSDEADEGKSQQNGDVKGEHADTASKVFKDRKEKKEKASGEKKDRDKQEKGKEKESRDKKRKSDVQRIQKKLEKIEAKISRILSKRDECVRRLAEAQEKERVKGDEAPGMTQDFSPCSVLPSNGSGDPPHEGVEENGSKFEPGTREQPSSATLSGLDFDTASEGRGDGPDKVEGKEYEQLNTSPSSENTVKHSVSDDVEGNVQLKATS